MRYLGGITKNIVWIFLLVPLLLFAYIDSDLDGVSDEHDLCPNTPITDIVDINGCTIEKLVIPNVSHHFDIIVGANYVDNKNFNSSYIMDYYYNNKFSMQLKGANYEEGGLGDTTLNLFYNLKPMQNLSMRVGVGAVFPTYDSPLDNNNMDYKASFYTNYHINKASIFGGVGYTIVNDDDINSTNYKVDYQNSINYYIGAGYYLFSNLYSSISYSISDSIYKGSEDIKNISLFNYYKINKNWFTTFGYGKGMSDSSVNYLYLNLGFYY